VTNAAHAYITIFGLISGEVPGSLAAGVDQGSADGLDGPEGLDNVVNFLFVVTGPSFTRVYLPRGGNRPRC